jgi:hypothetical protein
MDLRVRHFPDEDAALWPCRGFRITMAMEYVIKSVRLRLGRLLTHA